MIRTLALLSLVAGPAAAAELPVRGQAVDPQGEPLAGAVVVLTRAPTPWERLLLLLDGGAAPHPEAATRSGADGRFELVAPEPDAWEISVSSAGRVPMTTGAVLVVEATMLPPVELAPDVPLELRVLDGDGRPLTGVPVGTDEVEAPGFWPPGQISWRARQRARTDARGVAVLPRRAGERLDVTAHPPAAAPIRAEGLAEAGTLRSPPTRSRTLRLTDSDGAPLAGAIAVAAAAGWPIGRTGEDGGLEVRCEPGRPLPLVVVLADGRHARLEVAPGREPVSAGTPRPSAAGTSPAGRSATDRTEAVERDASEGLRHGDAAVQVGLEAPLRRRGRVVDANTREPLAGAIVYAAYDARLRTRTRSDGAFELAGPSPGLRWIAAAAPGHSPAATEALEPSATIALPPAWALRGLVVDATGEPLPDASVVAFPRLDGGRRFGDAWGSSARAVSASNGFFELIGLRQGLTYTVGAELFGVGRTEAVARPEEAGRLLELVLATGASLTGQLVDETDAPVAGATLRLGESREGGRSLAWSRAVLDPRRAPQTTSDADGTFGWEHLRPGSWDLVVTADGYAQERVPGIELEEGRAHDLGLLHLAAGTPLEGRVEDPDGSPLEGARIRIVPPQPAFVFLSSEPPPAPDAVSDAEGWFSIPDRRPDEELDLIVERDAFVPREVPGVGVGGEPLVIELEPAASLTGTVVGEDGSGVANASVRASPEGGSTGPGGRLWSGEILSHTMSDEDGRFELGELPAGRIVLRVEATGWLSEERSGLAVSLGRNEPLTIRLRRGASVEGRVFGADGAPVADAVVGVVEDGSYGFSAVPTDADGRYSLDGVEAGRRLLSATAEDGRSVSRELEVVDGVNALDLVFEPGWPVAGVAVTEEGAPVPDALLTLTVNSGAGDALRTRTDALGAFTFEDVREGTYTLRGSHPDFASTLLDDPVEVRGPVAGLQLRLAAGARVVGTLLGLDESELRRARVFARDGRASFVSGRVVPDGSYSVPALAPGEWTVLASAPDGRSASETISIVPGEREVSLDLTFKDGYTLSGTVLLDREPLPGARLVLRNEDIADSAWGRTDHRGRFEIRGLEPGRYGLVVSRFEDGLHHQEELTLLDDEEVLIEIERLRVAGRVVEAGTEEPITGATVRLEPKEVDPALLPTSTRGPGARSDSSGAFSMGSVDAGLYDLSVSADGHARLDTVLQVGPADIEDLVLRLETSEGVALRVLLPDGRPAGMVSLVAVDPLSGGPIDGRRVAATSEGDVRLQSLPRGRWTLLIGSGDAAVSELTVSVPGDLETVQLPPGSRLEVAVPDLTGPVVPAATVSLQRPEGTFFRHPGSGELRQRWSLWNGRTTVENLPAGTWIVHVEATDGRRWDETVAVQAGAVQAVEIR